MSAVRESGPADHPRLAASLAAAFQNDPVAKWAAPHDEVRRSVLNSFFLEYLRQKQRYDTVWCDDELFGAALWLPPGRSKMGVVDSVNVLRRTARPRMLSRGPFVAWASFQVERRHPEEDFFYLTVLGVDPAAQGGGIGSKVLAPALEICDQDGVGAYLESSKPENIDFYARHGFRVVGEYKLPRGPVVPLMWRDPR